MADQEDDEIQKLANAVAVELDADVLLYTSDIESAAADRVMDITRSRNRREDVVLLLCTYGGAADAAYRIARCLQRSYRKITVVVDGVCKSAGTLITLGSDELVLSDYAELGPLDVQVLRDDDIMVRRSGLTPTQALLSLQGSSFLTFKEHFHKMRFEMQLPTRMAAQMASEMSIGVFGQIYSQIDPMRLGEIDRAMRVAAAYADRLTKQRKNLKPGAVATLLAGYPSHEFVIDRQEADTLFNSVREPSVAEAALLAEIGVCRTPPERGPGFIDFLSEEKIDASASPATSEEPEDAEGNGSEHRAPTAGTGAQDGSTNRDHEQSGGTDVPRIRASAGRASIPRRISAGAPKRS